ncbi:MAG: flagellar basal body-associated FliL family protein [Bacteroidetes bacterium]|nr:flagellar basal body-associated FliL family protein [Bacteroidota bacterium]MCX7906806.1 flagellar basal body-associated FliL family protein [Bacteroidota bacterium]MDW8136915.1 flagellar basal body-associated FliL family protein [Bacteroidota bacterium]MDW8285215.1 flagellar basal body-associated FliL family protein [Bacteroidota bacterium]
MAEPTPKKGIPRWLWLGVLPAVILLELGVTAYLVLNDFDRVHRIVGRLRGSSSAQPEGTQPEPGEQVQRGPGVFGTLENITINPAGTQGRRYLLVSFGLEAPSAVILEEVKEKDIVIRDRVIRILSQKTVEELADVSQREAIKVEVLAGINEVLQKGKIRHLYFTQYVLQ